MCNQGDTAAVIVGRQKRNRTSNKSNLDNNNALTSDVTLLSPMGVFDDPVDNSGTNADREQSTSFDGVLMANQGANNIQGGKQAMNKKDRRGAAGFFQKKELQLHTTIRKGKA